MWDRKELNEKGKAAFKANYWKCVLVGFLLVLFATGTGASAGRSSTNSMNAVNNQNSVVVVTDGTTTYAVDGQTAAEVQNAIEESEFMAAMQDPAFQLAVRSMAAALGAAMANTASVLCGEFDPAAARDYARKISIEKTEGIWEK